MQRELTRILGLQAESPYAMYDHHNLLNQTYEDKYAKWSSSRKAYSFPQIIRRDRPTPDTYIIVLFDVDNNLKAFVVPGDKMHTSIINRNSTPAHADNPDERRINIKPNTPEMEFLERYSNPQLCQLLMASTYNAISFDSHTSSAKYYLSFDKEKAGVILHSLYKMHPNSDSFHKGWLVSQLAHKLAIPMELKMVEAYIDELIKEGQILRVKKGRHSGIQRLFTIL
jgi:hypothetical protein